VIDDDDTEQSSCTYGFPRRADIVGRWCRVPGRVVVRDDDRARVQTHGGAEQLSDANATPATVPL